MVWEKEELRSILGRAGIIVLGLILFLGSLSGVAFFATNLGLKESLVETPLKASLRDLEQRVGDWERMAHYFSTLQIPLQQTILFHRSTLQSPHESLQPARLTTLLNTHFPQVEWQREETEAGISWQGSVQQEESRSYQVRLQLLPADRSSEPGRFFLQLQFTQADAAHIYQVGKEWNEVLGEIHIYPYYFVEVSGKENAEMNEQDVEQSLQLFEALLGMEASSHYRDHNSWVTAYQDPSIQHQLPHSGAGINLQWMIHRNEERRQIHHKMGTPILTAE